VAGAGGDDNYLDALARMIRAEAPPSRHPDDYDAMLFRLYAVLLVAVGERVTARDVHNAWVAWKLEQNPAHPALLPFEDLPHEVAALDNAYVHAIRRVAAHLARSNTHH
jgi:hypothetical protein